MKLFKKILPVATLASAATVVAPVVGSCACGSTIKLNVCDSYTAGGSDVYYLTSKKKLNLKAEKQYTFKISLSDYIWDGVVSSAQPEGMFLLVEGEIGTTTPTTIPMSSAEVTIDQKKLKYVNGFEELEEASYTIMSTSDMSFLVYLYSKVSDESKLTIKVELDKEKSDIQPLYVPAGGM